MLRDSFWYPNTGRSAAFVLAVVAMIVLHQSEFLGLMDSTVLLFGWLPVQLAYDVTFNLIGAVILFTMYHAAPEPPATHKPPASEAVEPSEPREPTVGGE